MLTRLKNWVRGSGQRKRERWEADYGHLSDQEKHLLDTHKASYDVIVEHDEHSPKAFDEQSRGKPRH